MPKDTSLQRGVRMTLGKLLNTRNCPDANNFVCTGGTGGCRYEISGNVTDGKVGIM